MHYVRFTSPPARGVRGCHALGTKLFDPPVGLGLGVLVTLRPFKGVETALLIAAVMARDSEQQVGGAGQPVSL